MRPLRNSARADSESISRLDHSTLSKENHITMKTIETTTDPDMVAIIESLSTGKPIPKEIRDRMREEGEKVREEVRKRIGPTNMAADLIRESRDE